LRCFSKKHAKNNIDKADAVIHGATFRRLHNHAVTALVAQLFSAQITDRHVVEGALGLSGRTAPFASSDETCNFEDGKLIAMLGNRSNGLPVTRILSPETRNTLRIRRVRWPFFSLFEPNWMAEPRPHRSHPAKLLPSRLS
jgi:hypothetical protein